ncbi:MAG TPA: CpcT/CpeT family chromophore lyase [Steroidobacteraceae bacterium]|nr:CpcT/CpeT family chromophore lyase [Steroidobacteraceae bacterium]
MVERGARARLLLGLALATLAACAHQAQRQQEELGDILAWFPGRYDNLAQVQRDENSAVHPVHDRVALLVVPVQAPRLGHHIFYVQEMAPDNAERIMSQRMFSFDVDEDRGVIGLMYTFVEPVRWRQVARDPHMLEGLMTEDVAPSGCELVFKRAGEDAFTAAGDPKHCRRTGGKAAADVRLSADSLTLGGFEFRKGG